MTLREKVREIPLRSILTPRQKEEVKAVVGKRKPAEVGLDEEFWDITTLLLSNAIKAKEK